MQDITHTQPKYDHNAVQYDLYDSRFQTKQKAKHLSVWQVMKHLTHLGAHQLKPRVHFSKNNTKIRKTDSIGRLPDGYHPREY